MGRIGKEAAQSYLRNFAYHLLASFPKDEALFSLFSHLKERDMVAPPPLQLPQGEAQWVRHVLLQRTAEERQALSASILVLPEAQSREAECVAELFLLTRDKRLPLLLESAAHVPWAKFAKFRDDLHAKELPAIEDTLPPLHALDHLRAHYYWLNEALQRQPEALGLNVLHPLENGEFLVHAALIASRWPEKNHLFNGIFQKIRKLLKAFDGPLPPLYQAEKYDAEGQHEKATAIYEKELDFESLSLVRQSRLSLFKGQHQTLKALIPPSLLPPFKLSPKLEELSAKTDDYRLQKAAIYHELGYLSLSRPLFLEILRESPRHPQAINIAKTLLSIKNSLSQEEILFLKTWLAEIPKPPENLLSSAPLQLNLRERELLLCHLSPTPLRKARLYASSPEAFASTGSDTPTGPNTSTSSDTSTGSDTSPGSDTSTGSDMSTGSGMSTDSGTSTETDLASHYNTAAGRLNLARRLLSEGQMAESANVLQALLRRPHDLRLTAVYQLLFLLLEKDETQDQLISAVSRHLPQHFQLLQMLEKRPDIAFHFHKDLLLIAETPSIAMQSRLRALTAWFNIWKATKTSPPPKLLYRLAATLPSLIALALHQNAPEAPQVADLLHQSLQRSLDALHQISTQPKNWLVFLEELWGIPAR